jgi:histidinol dehydrogenase
VAADLLAQAEHGSGDETVVLVTPSRALAAEVTRLVAEGLGSVANRASTRRALERNAAVVLVRDLAEGEAAVNALAPEHVEVLARGASRLARRIVAGAVFVGPFSPVAVGDYGIGPNHVLPTGGSARFASPLSVRDFQRRQSVVTLSRRGLARVVEDVVRVAMAEGFRGHAQSVLTRFEGA